MRAGDQALAGAVFAGDQHVRVGGADAGDHLQHGLHRLRLRDQRGLAFAAAAQQRVLGFEALAVAQRLAQFGLRAQDRQQARVLPRLLHEVARAAAHRFDRDVDAAPGGHDDDGQRGVERAQVVEQIEPFLAGRRVARVIEVHQDDVELAAFDRGDDAGGRGGGLNLIALGLEQQAERFEHVGLIVRHEDPRHAARGAVGGAIGSAGRGERI